MTKGTRLLQTAYWTLWVTSVAMAAYGLVAELFSLSISTQGRLGKYHLSTEAHVVTAVGLCATLLLAAVFMLCRGSLRHVRGFTIGAFLLQFAYIFLPRF